MILPHDAGVEPNPAMTGGRCVRRGEARIGCLARAITSPSHHSHPQPDLRQGLVMTLLLCFVAFVFHCFSLQCIYVPPPEFRLDLIYLPPLIWTNFGAHIFAPFEWGAIIMISTATAIIIIIINNNIRVSAKAV